MGSYAPRGYTGLNPFVFRAFDNRRRVFVVRDSGGLNPFVFRAFDNRADDAMITDLAGLNPFVFRAFDNQRYPCKPDIFVVLIPLFSGHSIIRDRRFTVSAQ